jgi:inhibitor of cysteine peptidase
MQFPKAPAALLALVALAGCASLLPQTPTIVQASHSGGAVRLLQGDTLVVALDANPGSGYRWQVRPIDGSLLQQIGPADLLPADVAPGTVGAANDTVYRFRAAGTGTATLELAYLRPLETTAPQRTVHYDVTVIARPGEYAQAWAKTR